jgi:hypothetical protein
MKNIWKYFFLLLSTSAAAQNLVPNPSFEQFDTCPSNISQITRAAGWNAVRPTPDYFNSCSTDTLFNGQIIVGVPSNFCGYRTAASGTAYSGIISKGGSSEDREIIGTQLLTPLQIGTKYFVSFQVSLAGHANPNQYCGINKLGALFSTTLYVNLSSAPICNCSQIYSNLIITDTLEWTRITGSFIADSNYSAINIGRFYSNATTDSIQIAGTLGFAYYFVDDICVSTDSVYCATWTGIIESANQPEINSLSIFPNPTSQTLFIRNNFNINIKKIDIVNSIGDLIYSINSYKITPLFSVDVSNYSRGVYYLSIMTSKMKYTKKVIVIN